MSIVELERPSPAVTCIRHPVPARLHSLRPGGVGSAPAPFDDLAIVFPARRPCGTAATALAHRGVPGFDARASATAWLIEEGLEPLDLLQKRRVIHRWGDVRDNHGRTLVGDGGCDVRLGRTAVDTAEREALLAWLPLTYRELAVYEGGLFEGSPAHAIALLVRPPTIWPLDEALQAEQLFPRGRCFDPRRFAAIEHYAYGRIAVEQESRLGRVVAWIAAQLPFHALPVASAIVGSGCALVVADDGRGRAVVARQLARYASSSLVAACARDGR
jgi:hypothetical protein